MKQRIVDNLRAASLRLVEQAVVPAAAVATTIQVGRTRDPSHGDFSSNLALMIAKAAGKPPRALAQLLVDNLPGDRSWDRVEIAGPGFINFHLSHLSRTQVVAEVIARGVDYGRIDIGGGTQVQVEFVSANPTGPLHVGHGRGAAYGSALANLLEVAGYRVEREYYVNDAGRQMDILAVSVWLRYLESHAQRVSFPVGAYQGDYIKEIAATVTRRYGNELCRVSDLVFADLPADGPAGSDADAHIDALIGRAKALLAGNYEPLRDLASGEILADIEADLAEFGVRFDRWFRESGLLADGTTQRVMDRLMASGHLYEKEGARWFRSTEFGDTKDRVLIRENGEPTYFATDIGYHEHKFKRGYDRMVNVWGSDHHGYVARLKAALAALGHDPELLRVVLVQFATLYRGSQRVQMSTRSGEFITLKALRNEVGSDATRFFYLLHRPDQHMDFDMELAKSKSNDNPVYYVQYAHARIHSVLEQARAKGFVLQEDIDGASLQRLVESEETELLRGLARYPEVIEAAAIACEPHQLAYYLRELATEFHTYYTVHQFLVDDAEVRSARLALVKAVQTVIANGLGILGVSVPDAM